MSFLFATSHLPETARIKGILRGAARPPEEDEDEEEEEPSTQPAPRSVRVRALSHLPDPVRAQADSDGPLSTRPAIPVGRPRTSIAPEADPDHDYAAEEDHAPEADHEPDHAVDPDSDLHDPSEDDTGPHEPEDSSPWYKPRISPDGSKCSCGHCRHASKQRQGDHSRYPGA